MPDVVVEREILHDPPRPLAHLRSLAREFPGAWKAYDAYRAERGRGLPRWPDWCFCPMAAAYAVASGGADRVPVGPSAGKIAELAALAAWRVGQGIYRFDADLYSEVLATPLTGDLPEAVLFQLPEWCVYVETPDLVGMAGDPVHGFFAHLEHDANDGRAELRLLLDEEASDGPFLRPVPLHLVGGGLVQALEAADRERLNQLQRFPALLSRAPSALGEIRDLLDEARDGLRRQVEPLLSLLLYLCSENADLDPCGRRPPRPRPRKTKAGLRLFPPDAPTTWEVGLRVGAALHRARAVAGDAGDGTHASPRPHVRRAHWHTFWVGPRSVPEQRKAVLRWLSPMLVGARSVEDLVPTVRPVES